MVSVNEVYAENGDNWNYLNSATVVSEHLENKALTIKNAEVKQLGNGEEARNKIVVSFDETDKQLALNSTNSKIIAEEFGDDTEEWAGNKISLMVVKKNFAGKLVNGIQVQV